ncbi:MAG: hypothetical protein ACJA13_000688 [Paraglaciecola sp.]|jgi:hypothetical protein
MRKRQENGFNLAFLDVMACGLGAVILILIIINFNDDSFIPSEEIERLEQELAATEDRAQSLKIGVAAQVRETRLKQAGSQTQAKSLANLKIQLKTLQQATADKKAVVASLENAIAASAALNANDAVRLPQVNEENYLLGLVVEGQRIGILLDTSASMTDQALIDIIKRQLSSERTKQAGAKWQRTLRIVKWMMARLPETSQVSVVGYNETAKNLGPRAVSPVKVNVNLVNISKELDALIPQNGTNLQVGLAQIKRAMPDMTDLYIITDGLPSLVQANSGFAVNRQCNPIKGKQATISGQCRVEAMLHTMNTSPLKGVRTHVVLLPLEGDPQAAAFYWQMANVTGGTFISPASTWP